MATWSHLSAKSKTNVLQEGLHTGSEGGRSFPSRGSRSLGGRAGRTALAKTSCVKGGTHPKYLNNVVEQDHRAVKRVTRPMLGFKSFETAQDTLVGIELMHMIKKKQLIVEEGDEGRTAAELFYSLAA